MIVCLIGNRVSVRLDTNNSSNNTTVIANDDVSNNNVKQTRSRLICTSGLTENQGITNFNFSTVKNAVGLMTNCSSTISTTSNSQSVTSNCCNQNSFRVNLISLTNFNISDIINIKGILSCTHTTRDVSNRLTVIAFQVYLLNSSRVASEVCDLFLKVKQILSGDIGDAIKSRLETSCTAEDVFTELESIGIIIIVEVNGSCSYSNNSSVDIRNNASNSAADQGEDTRDIAKLHSLNISELQSCSCILNICGRLRRIAEYNVRTLYFKRLVRRLNNTIKSDDQLIGVSDNGFGNSITLIIQVLYSQRECDSLTVKQLRDIIDLLNSRSQDLLRGSQILLTEANLSVVKVSVDRFNQSVVLQVGNDCRFCQVDRLSEFKCSLFVFNRTLLNQTQFTEYLETSRVYVGGKDVSPVRDSNRSSNTVGEVLVEVGVLDLLNDLRRFTNVVNESTRRSGNSTDFQNTFSDAQVVNSTRCLGDSTRDILTRNKIASVINDLQNSGTFLPTIVL